MIEVTKLTGERVFVNADLIETVEPHPDTVMILSNGKHFIVRERAEEIVARIVEYQRSVRSGWSAAKEARGKAHPAGDAGQDRGAHG